MKILVGSQNHIKLAAVEQALQEYEQFSGAHIQGIAVDSGVPAQPITLEQIATGASNRARRAFDSDPTAALGIGLEGGLAAMPFTHTGYLNIEAAVVYDGRNFYTGLSTGFEHPAEVIELTLNQGHEIGTAYKAAGLHEAENLGRAEGAIGFMTFGKVDRTEYGRQGLVVALATYLRRDLLRVVP